MSQLVVAVLLVPAAGCEGALVAAARKGDAERVRSEMSLQPQRPQVSAAILEAARSGQIPSLQVLLDGGGDPNATDASGTPALLFAIDSGSADVVGALLAHGADPNRADKEGWTALGRAVCSPHRAVAPILAALRAAGADLDAEQPQGDRPIHCAVRNKDGDAVRWLVAGGARVSVRNLAGASPYTLALQLGATEIVPLLTPRDVVFSDCWTGAIGHTTRDAGLAGQVACGLLAALKTGQSCAHEGGQLMCTPLLDRQGPECRPVVECLAAQVDQHVDACVTEVTEAWKKATSAAARTSARCKEMCSATKSPGRRGGRGGGRHSAAAGSSPVPPDNSQGDQTAATPVPESVRQPCIRDCMARSDLPLDAGEYLPSEMAACRQSVGSLMSVAPPAAAREAATSTVASPGTDGFLRSLAAATLRDAESRRDAMLFYSAAALFDSIDRPRAIQAAERAVELDAGQKRALVFLAVHAMDKSLSDAFDYLTRAAKAGYADVEEAESSPQLAPARGDPRWAAFVAAVSANAVRSTH